MSKVRDRMAVPRILWRAAGKPAGDGVQEGVCRICGNASLGLLFEGWVRGTFTDRDKLQSGTIICHACQFCFAERSELLMQRVGKEKPQRMRNYSHFVVDGRWFPVSKADKRLMSSLLLRTKWQVAVIAQSGQKHLIFRAAPGTVQFEEQQILNVHDLDDLLSAIETLYASFSKTEIRTGDYAQHRVLKFGVMSWNKLEREIKPDRQSTLFALALFLAQKEKHDGGAKSAPPASSGVARRSVARDTKFIQESLPTFDLAAV